METHRQPTLEEKELEIHILITHLAEPNPTQKTGEPDSIGYMG